MGNPPSDDDERFPDNGEGRSMKDSDDREEWHNLTLETRDRRQSDVHDGLSRRERTVLTQLQQGMSNKEISLALGISPRTVQKHLQRIYYHLGVQTRVEAIVWMHQRVR